MRLASTVLGIALLASLVRDAAADPTGCHFETTTTDGPLVQVSTTSARLVARLVDPPRTKVTLSIDDASGNHTEVIWDPALNDGLQHSVFLHGSAPQTTAALPTGQPPNDTRTIPGTPAVSGGPESSPAADSARQLAQALATGVPPRVWRFALSADEERIQTGQLVLLINTTFKPSVVGEQLSFIGSKVSTIASAGSITSAEPSPGPKVILTCEDGQIDLSSMKLDAKRVAAAATARGLLDQATPAPLVEALQLLADIAVERAKAGVMDLVRAKFIDPMCRKVTLESLGLRGKVGFENQAFPHVCALLEQLRLEDVLSSGRGLFAAARDDIRYTIAPALISRMFTNDESREIASMALKFANSMVDGQSSAVVELDLLVALLDHVSWSSGFERSEKIVLEWLAGLGLDKKAGVDLVRRALDRGLPLVFWDDPKSPFLSFAACKRRYKDEELNRRGWLPQDGQFPAGYYYPPVREACLKALLDHVFEERTLAAAVTFAMDELHWFELSDLVQEIRLKTKAELSDFLQTKFRIDPALAAPPALTATILKELPNEAFPVLKSACAVRLVVGIAKWCSSRDSCSGGEIADLINDPSKLFKATMRPPESMCWTGPNARYYTGKFIELGEKKQLIDLGFRLVSFLTPAKKGEERERALSMTRWLFAVARTMSPDPRLDQLETVVVHLVDGDYVRALAESLTLAQGMCRGGSCAGFAPSKKAMELFGAVGSYAQTYEETKSLAPEEARKARKKALEALIDSATDRTDRKDEVVYSLGIPVGFSAGAQWLPATASQSLGQQRGYVGEFGYHLRVPLSFAVQRLPGGTGTPFHVAAWVADLGQFARPISEGSSDKVRWTDFIGFGIQFGYLLGTSTHAFVVGAEASYAPRSFDDNATMSSGAGPYPGAYTVGLALAYYVPLFDLN